MEPPQNDETSEPEFQDLDDLLLTDLPPPLVASPSPVSSSSSFQKKQPQPSSASNDTDEPFASLLVSSSAKKQREQQQQQPGEEVHVAEPTTLPVARYPDCSSGLYRLAPPHIANPAAAAAAARQQQPNSATETSSSAQASALLASLEQLYLQVHGRPPSFRPSLQIAHHPGQQPQPHQLALHSYHPYLWQHHLGLPPPHPLYHNHHLGGLSSNPLAYRLTSTTTSETRVLAALPPPPPSLLDSIGSNRTSMDPGDIDGSPLGEAVPMADLAGDEGAAAAAPPPGKFFAVRAASSGEAAASTQQAGAVFLSYADAQKHIADNYSFAGARYLLRGFNDLGDAARFASEGTVNVMTLEDNGAPGVGSRGVNAEEEDGRKRAAVASPSKKKKKKSKTGAAGGGDSPRRRVETQPRKPYKQWEAQCAALQQHHAATGSFAVDGEDEASRRLRRWITEQRAEYRTMQSGQKTKMTQEKVDRLTGLGFDFGGTAQGTTLASLPSPTPRTASAPRGNYKPRKEWQEMYAKLLAYKEAHGTTIVPRDDKANQELRLWMNEQNMGYRQMREGKVRPGASIGRLTDEKKRLLEEAGHEFVHYTFDERMQQLKKFKEDNAGSVAVPVDDALLGKWATKMREKYRKYEDGQRVPGITKEQIEQLTAVGFTNSRRKIVNKTQEEEHWNNMFAELEQYKKDNGNCNVSTTPPHTDLTKWVIAQRREYKKLKENKESLLTASRLMRLNDIGFQFRQRANYTSWEDRVGQLREYKNQHGHLKIPISDPDLGWFVSSQREEYRKRCDGKPSSLTDERYNDLNSLGFVFIGGKRKGSIKAPRKTWDERFQELVAFRNANGHACVPQHYPGLGYWVHAQRNQYRLMKQGKKSPMTNEKALRLAEIGMVWDAQKKRGGTSDVIVPGGGMLGPASGGKDAVATAAAAAAASASPAVATYEDGEGDEEEDGYHSASMTGDMAGV